MFTIRLAGQWARAASREQGGVRWIALSRLRQAWEPRMLSILRIVVGLLFLEHGTQKIFNFPPRPDPAGIRAVYAGSRSGRNPGAGRRSADRARAVHAAGGLFALRRDGVRLFHVARAARVLPDQQRRRWRRFSIASSFCTSASSGPACGASMRCARRRPRRAAPRAAAERRCGSARGPAELTRRPPGWIVLRSFMRGVSAGGTMAKRRDDLSAASRRSARGASVRRCGRDRHRGDGPQPAPRPAVPGAAVARRRRRASRAVRARLL